MQKYFHSSTGLSSTCRTFPLMQTIVATKTVDLLAILPVLLLLGLFIVGLTLLYTVILTLDSDRKKQGIAAALLLVAMLLFFASPLSVPEIFSGLESLLAALSALSLIPLSAIIPGVLWFWTGRRSEIVKTTLLCAVTTFIAWMLICQVPAAFIPSALILSLFSLLLNAADGIPMGISLIYLAVFLASSAIVCIVYILMRIAGSRELPGWLNGWLAVKGRDRQQ